MKVSRKRLHRAVLKGGVGGGSWDPKVCAAKMAKQDFP